MFAGGVGLLLKTRGISYGYVLCAVEISPIKEPYGPVAYWSISFSTSIV